jgi:hypothetical protein
MTVVKAPQTTERRAEALIDKAPNASKSNQGNPEVAVTVRIPKAMLRDIERAVKQRPIKTPRHTWLMEAIYEKWEREKKSR